MAKTQPKIGPSSQAATWQKIDGRGVVARRLRAYRDELTEHVGGSPSATERVLIDRAAMLRVQLELMDQRSLKGAPLPDHTARSYIAWSNALRLVLQALGLERRGPRQKSLAELLAEGSGKAA